MSVLKDFSSLKDFEVLNVKIDFCLVVSIAITSP